MPSKKEKAGKVRIPEEFKRAIVEGIPTETEHNAAVQESEGFNLIGEFMKSGKAPYFPEE